MSSTQRGYVRHKSDYYITPIDKVELFLKEFIKYEPNAFDGIILDACAGGDENNPMRYPEAIKNTLNKSTKTIDVREDSLAEIKGDFLRIQITEKPKVIITNPPFNLSREIIEKSLLEVEDGGFVIMLLRLNYFGGKLRRDLWDNFMPKYTFVHNRRI